ncbi:MAG TPA: hypothetical protein VGW58_01930 [Pyrinomonadaceae bacterium]|nr:hypothetical protein [Pyrinomonadaceae bacterium]
MTRKEKSDGHKTETPDVSHIRNVEVTHETSDINVRGVLTFVVALTVATALISLGMWLLFRYFNVKEAERKPGPMALQQSERLPPEPRLQAAPGFEVKLQDGQVEKLQLEPPQAEYRVLKEQWERALRGELKDQSGNPVSIPIEQAIDLVIAGGGLRTKAAIAPTKLEDYAISLPTASSSGRETEKRVQ